MAGGKDNVVDDSEDLETDDDTEDRLIADDDDDGEDTDIMNVDEIVSKIDKQSDIERKRQIRRRLEELQEQRLAMRELDSTYNFNMDDDY
jgi:hypothetical protein